MTLSLSASEVRLDKTLPEPSSQMHGSEGHDTQQGLRSGRHAGCGRYPIRLFSPFRRLVLPCAISLAIGPEAHSVSAARIEDPLPSELRERVADLMRTVRPIDAEAALGHTKILDGPIWRELGLLCLRVETDCPRGLCMTIVARVSEKVIRPELFVMSGSRIDFADHGSTLWGGTRASFPIWLDGLDGSAITLLERNGTWVIGSCGSCFYDRNDGRGGDKASESTTSRLEPRLPPYTFEKFRQELEPLR